MIAVYTMKHTKPINTKCGVTDWDMHFHFGFEGLMKELT
jgi:hypothetical protein